MLNTFRAIALRLRPTITPLCFAPVAAIMFTPLYSPLFASESRAAPITNPVDIDNAVRSFTGAPIGAIGGALAPADPRLRLAKCMEPLATSWYGTTRAAVRVECPVTAGNGAPWRIFVATRPAPSPITPSPVARPVKTAPIVKRGDPVTVIVRGTGFSVQQAGEAMENGGIGDWIGIRTSRRGDPVRARIERPGLAVIPVD